MKKSFIFLTKSQLNFYGSNLPALATLPLPPEIFQDMEIVNEEEFTKAIQNFITTNKIEPSEYIQIFNTDLVIEKDISLQETAPSPLPSQPPTDQQPVPSVKEPPKSQIKNEEKIQQEIDEFLSIVPFENTLQFINRKDKKGIKVYVTNKDIFTILKAIFESKGFVSQGITAMPLLGENPVATLDPHAAKNLLSHYDTLKTHQFPMVTAAIKNDAATADDFLVEEEKPEGSNNILMIVVLLIIVGVLGGLAYVIWSQFNTKPKQAKAIVIPTLTPVIASSSATIVPTGTSSSSSSASLEEKKVTIQILNGSGVAGQADQVKTEFTKQGFTDVTTGNASGITLSKTLVVFKKEVTPSTREKIVQILKTRFTDVSVQETTEGEFDVLITTVRTVTPTPTSRPTP